MEWIPSGVNQDSIVSVKTLILMFGMAAGCFGANATFTADVWPILERRCVNCHQAGEIAPMALTSYKLTRPWAAAMREAVRARTMPPWSATAGGHAFRNDRSLTAQEIATVVGWVDSGAAEGVGAVVFHAAVPDAGWKLGKPDVIIRVPGFQVPPSGQVPYSFLISSGLFPKDTWIRAAEWRIDQRGSIHHMNAFTRTPESSFLEGFPTGQVFVPTLAERGKRKTGEKVFDRRQLLLGYEPGYQPAAWLEDGAKFVKAGSDVVFEMHYTPSGKAVTDYSEFGLYLAPATPRYRVLAIDTLRDLDLQIPPGERDYVSHATMTLGQEARLLSIQPHLHLRGKSQDVRAVYPDGRSDELLRVRWDLNWQTTFAFRDPLRLPAGTRLDSVATFDNSITNPFNPDATATVRWGDQTSDEMHIAFLELVIDAKADPENLFQKALR